MNFHFSALGDPAPVPEHLRMTGCIELTEPFRKEVRITHLQTEAGKIETFCILSKKFMTQFSNAVYAIGSASCAGGLMAQKFSECVAKNA